MNCLLEAGARIQPDYSDTTSLHIAAKHNYLEIIRALLEKSPNTGDHLRMCDHDNETALTYAIAEGQLKTVKLLIKAESDMKPGLSCSQLFDIHPAWLPPAHMACLRGQPEILRYFIEERGINVNSKTQAGRRIRWPHRWQKHKPPAFDVSLLDCVIGQGTEPEVVHCLEYLLFQDADLSEGSAHAYRNLNAVDLAWLKEDFRSLALMARDRDRREDNKRIAIQRSHHLFGLDHDVSPKQLQGSIPQQKDAL